MPKSIPLLWSGYLLLLPLPNRVPVTIDMPFSLTSVLAMVLGLALNLERTRKIDSEVPSNFEDQFDLLEQGSP